MKVLSMAGVLFHRKFTEPNDLMSNSIHFSCFNHCFTGIIIRFCCDAVFNDAIVSAMVCIFTAEYHSRRLYWILAICARIDGIHSEFYFTLNCSEFYSICCLFILGNFKSGDSRVGRRFSGQIIPRDLLLFGWHTVRLRKYSSCMCDNMVSD